MPLPWCSAKPHLISAVPIFVWSSPGWFGLSVSLLWSSESQNPVQSLLPDICQARGSMKRPMNSPVLTILREFLRVPNLRSAPHGLCSSLTFPIVLTTFWHSVHLPNTSWISVFHKITIKGWMFDSYSIPHPKWYLEHHNTSEWLSE